MACGGSCVVLDSTGPTFLWGKFPSVTATVVFSTSKGKLVQNKQIKEGKKYGHETCDSCDVTYIE